VSSKSCKERTAPFSGEGGRVWNYQIEELADGKAFRFSFEHPYHEILEGWRNDEEFRQFFSNLLIDCPLEAFTWEAAPVCGRTVEQNFECVVIKSNRLAARRASPAPFSSKFQDTEQSVVTFLNYDHDALLVVPRPLTPPKAIYSHLKSFLTGALKTQQHDFWITLSQAITERLTIKPLWVSTSKVGVRWLHARVDFVPKHYRHAAYRDFQEPLLDA
jgi:hypothetical protein